MHSLTTGRFMNKKLKRIWALSNSVLMIFVLFCLAIWPERFFVIGDERRSIEIFVVIVMLFSTIFLLTLFISSFVTIQRSKECEGTTIFHLIGSMLSLLFLMAVKVLADEIGHEWVLGMEKVTQHGEFWIMYACLGLVLGFMVLVGLKKPMIS